MADKKKKKAQGKNVKVRKDSRTQQPDRAKKESQQKGVVKFTLAFPARVEEVVGRTGTRGEAVQVRCKIQSGPDANKLLRRNVKGPVRVNDILMLRETEIEARKLNQRRK